MSQLNTKRRTPRDFAEERSHRDAVVSNETIRATAQAVILINGGAATAILAYLAKSGLDSYVLRQLSLCLAIYGVGVFFGASMMYCAIRSLDFYNVLWRDIAFPGGFHSIKSDSDAGKKAHLWWKRSLRCFAFAMVAFIFSSVFAAYTLSISPPPQKQEEQQQIIDHKTVSQPGANGAIH